MAESKPVTETRRKTIEERFVRYGCSERFELIGITDSTHVMLRCKECGHEFSRVTTFLNQSKSHNVGCNACGIHVEGNRTNPRSDVKRQLDESGIIAYYLQGYSIDQTAAKFQVNARRVSRIVHEAGVARNVTKRDREDDAIAKRRAYARKHTLYQPKERRVKTIMDRFESIGASSRFEIAEITNRTHVVLRCLECGREFKRQTAFLDGGCDPNIGCPECGIHVDGTRSHTREIRKDVDETAVAAYYEQGYSSRQTALKFDISYARVNAIVDKAGVLRRDKDNLTPILDEYMHELTGDPFLDEEFLCAECGREFTRHDYMVNAGRTKVPIKDLDYCTRKCSNKASRKKRKAIGTGGAIRRARISRKKKQKIPLGDVVEKFGGICQLCGKPTDLSDIYYDENGNSHIGKHYPTRDHIVPVSKGGETTWDNIQLLCYECNSRKHNKSVA